MQIDIRDYKEKYFPLKLNDLSKQYPNIKTTRQGYFVKIINFSLKSNWNIWKQNFQLEIEYQVSLNHQFPNHILQIIDWAVEIQSVSVVVYINYNCKANSKSLNSFLNTSMISENLKLKIAEQIIQIAAILELSEIQHRNIKLNNFILIDNQVYLTDFGSARTHYNHYTKQSSNSEERHKQNETLFYSSPEIIEIITQDNVDFQESEWEQIFRNDSYKNVILRRNDNWSISIIILQLLSFQTQIADDAKQFYGYDIAKFDQDIKKQASNPQFKIMTDIIKKLSFGKISAINCLEYLKNQFPQRELDEYQQKNISKEEDQNIFNIQLKRQLQINTKVDYQYLSSAQIKQLQQISDRQQQKQEQQQSQKNNYQYYSIEKKENQVNEQINDSKSHISDENSFYIFSPKNNEEEQFGKLNLKQLCDYESSSFEEQKLLRINHIQVNSFNNNEQTLLLPQIYDDSNLQLNLKKQNNHQTNDIKHQTPSKLQVLIDDKNIVQKQEQIKTVQSLLNQKNQQGTLDQINDQYQPIQVKGIESTQYGIPFQQPKQSNIYVVQDKQQFNDGEPTQNTFKNQYEQFQTQNITPLQEQSQAVNKIIPQNQKETQKDQNVLHIIPLSDSSQIQQRKDSKSNQQIYDKKNQEELQIVQPSIIQQEFPFETEHSQKEQFSQQIVEFNQDSQFQSAIQIQDQEEGTSHSKIQIENFTSNQNIQINNKQLFEICESQDFPKPEIENQDQNNQFKQNQTNIKKEEQIITQQNDEISKTEIKKNVIKQLQSKDDCIQIEEMQITKSNVINNDNYKKESQQILKKVNDQPDNLEESYNSKGIQPEEQPFNNLLKIEQLKMLNSQQLYKYQEFLLKIKQNNEIDENEIKNQLHTIEQISNIKEKLNYTREQELILLNEEELNIMNEQQLDKYVIGLQVFLDLNDQTQKDNYPSQKEIEICIQNANKVKQNLIVFQENQNQKQASNQANQKLQNILVQPKADYFLSKDEFEELSYPQQIQYFNIVQQLINLQLKIQNGILTQEFQEQQSIVVEFKRIQDMVLTKSLINFNGLEVSKQFDNKEKNNKQRLVNPIRQSSITDEIIPFLIQDFESQNLQINSAKVNSPPNSRIYYNDKYNFQKHVENLNDFEIWSVNPRVKRFQYWKRFNSHNIQIPINLRGLCDFQKNRQKIENLQFKYGGYTLNNQAHGFGIMMKKPKGAIYEGIFDQGKFIYGIVLELNNESRLQKYLGYYNNQYETKHGQCKMVWYDEQKNGQFQIYEEHTGFIIFGQLQGEGKRWNTKERWLYIGEWKKSYRCGQGQYFIKNSNEEFILKYSGEFNNNKYHGQGKYYHSLYIYEQGEYINGNKVGSHQLYKDNILQKTINY